MPDLPVGSTFADHEILGVAGRGGMGVVYRARHNPLKREVALKVIVPELSADPGFRARFRRECEAAASIQHPHVIPVYHAGEQDGLLYVTMRFVEGGTDLSHVLAEGRVAPERAVSLISQVAEGLDAAHRRGLVHRDVKPANVLIEGVDSALLTDFGVTKDLRANTHHTDAGGFVGTFDYAAPEQFKSEPADARSDVYALGCVLFETLTGRVPFPGDSNAAKMFAHVQQPPPQLPGVPESLAGVVRRAMAKAPADRFASAGAFALAAQAALGPSTIVSSPPLAPPPALRGESSRGPFVGRADELKRLRRRYAGAQRAERQFVVVAGEPGIGKSRLAIEFAQGAHADGASVLYGRSDPESLVPYQPFITALQQRLSQPMAFPRELRPELSELGRFIPSLRSQASEAVADDPETRRYRLFEAVTRVLAYVAREHPVVLVLDDLQWADASTALLLAHVLNDPEHVRLLVLATMREQGEEPSEALNELLSRQRRQPSFERIALSGLDGEETEALVRAHGGSESTIARLRDETAGNPFFLEELLRSPDLDGVPEGVKAMIARRLSNLDETANQVLTVASVIGREFGLDVLEELVEGDIISALERAAAAGLVREVEDEIDRFLFAHALVRETLYEEQSASRRVRTHHRIAGVLEPFANPAEVAHHYLESRHLDRAGKAVEFSERAGAMAAAALAYDEAVRHFRNALSALGSDDPELLLELGDAEVRAGDPNARDTFLRAAAGARGPERERAARRGSRPSMRAPWASHATLARAALGFAGRHAASGLIDREAIALMEEALAELGDEESALVATLLARLANSLHFASAQERTFALSARALSMARRVGDTKALVAALESRHSALLHAEYLPERLELGEELLDLAQRIGDRELEALGHHLRVRDLLEATDFDAAHAHHRALRALADELHQPLYQHFAVCWDALWAQCAADNELAEQLSLEALELGKRAHVRPAIVIYASQALSRRFRMGVTPEVVARLEGLVQQGPGLTVWRAMLALAYARTGRRDEARAEFEHVAANDFAAVPRDMLWMSTLCLATEACVDLGDAERARVLYDLMWPYRGRHVQGGSASCSGSTERFLGMLAHALGDYDCAASHLASALAKDEEWGLLHIVPLVRVDYAQTLCARRGPGDLELAHALAVAAIPEAERVGMAPTVQKARACLLDPIEHA